MIDIEEDVFTIVATALRSKHTGITVYSELVLAPSVFPCVCIEEADNYTHRSSVDSSSNEHHANVMYEVNVYSNKTSGKKSECKKIFSTVDEILTGLGFTRNNKNPFSLDDATKYRIFGRYSAVVSKNKTIYRR